MVSHGTELVLAGSVATVLGFGILRTTWYDMVDDKPYSPILEGLAVGVSIIMGYTGLCTLALGMGTLIRNE